MSCRLSSTESSLMDAIRWPIHICNAWSNYTLIDLDIPIYIEFNFVITPTEPAPLTNFEWSAPNGYNFHSTYNDWWSINVRYYSLMRRKYPKWCTRHVPTQRTMPNTIMHMRNISIHIDCPWSFHPCICWPSRPAISSPATSCMQTTHQIN